LASSISHVRGTAGRSKALVRTVVDGIARAGKKGLVLVACFGFCVLALVACLGFGVLAWTLLRNAIP
jgi:hypothetical protein